MSSPGVGVVGSSLGGGVSWYSRQHGLQCSAITAVELVLADGTFVRATETQDADLLWAARGGHGGFGVVTSLEFDLLPVATAYAGMLAWDWRHARRVLTAWGEWTEDAPESVTSVARIFQVPDIEWLPAQLRGRKMVMIDAVALGDAEAGARSIAPLRALRPEVDTFAQVPAADIAHLQLDPQEPTAVYANSVLVARPPGGRRGGAGRVGRSRVGQQPALRRAAAARVARWRGPPLAVARSTTSTAPSWCSASGSTWAPAGAPYGTTPRGSWTRSPPGRPGRRTSRWPTRPPPGAAGRRRRTTGSFGSVGLWTRMDCLCCPRPPPTTDSAAELKSPTSPAQGRGCTFVGSTTTAHGGTMTIAQTSTARDVPFAELDALTIGTVAVPGDRKYDALVSPWNVAVPVRPAAVLAAHDAQDVVEAVQFAARHGIRVTPQATGHGPMADLTTELLVTTKELDEVVVHPERAGPAPGPA